MASVFFGAIKNVFQHGFDDTIETGAKVCSWLTGQDKYKEANELYTNLRDDIESAKQDYEKNVEILADEINTNISIINGAKKKIIRTLFPRFVHAANRFASWEIVISELIDRFDHNSRLSSSIESMRREDYFNIDFDDHSWKSCAKLVLLGIAGIAWSRWEANKTLKRVNELKLIVEEQKENIKAEKIRLNEIKNAIVQVREYFDKMTRSYEVLLDELEYSANMLISICYVINPSFHEKNIDCYFLPERHLRCLIATEKMTRILHDITERNYIDKDCNLINDDHEIIRIFVSETAAIRLRWAA